MYKLVEINYRKTDSPFSCPNNCPKSNKMAFGGYNRQVFPGRQRNTPIPRQELPQLPAFDGTGDFDALMETYSDRGEALGYSPAGLRIIFTQNLKGGAKEFYHSMRDRTEVTFGEIIRRFHDRYAQKEPTRMSAASQLHNCKQDSDETLEAFALRVLKLSQLANPGNYEFSAIQVLLENMHRRHRTESTRSIFGAVMQGNQDSFREIVEAIKDANQIDAGWNAKIGKEVSFAPDTAAQGTQQASTRRVKTSEALRVDCEYPSESKLSELSVTGYPSMSSYNCEQPAQEGYASSTQDEEEETDTYYGGYESLGVNRLATPQKSQYSKPQGNAGSKNTPPEMNKLGPQVMKQLGEIVSNAMVPSMDKFVDRMIKNQNQQMEKFVEKMIINQNQQMDKMTQDLSKEIERISVKQAEEQEKKEGRNQILRDKSMKDAVREAVFDRSRRDRDRNRSGSRSPSTERRCHFCNAQGHFIADCPSRRAGENTTNQTSGGYSKNA